MVARAWVFTPNWHRMVLRVAIIVPMYNEEAGAKNCLETILSYLPQLPGETSVVVVNDGSRDATQKIVSSFPVTLLNHGVNKGYGAALRTGIHHAIENNFDYALFVDSDLTNHPKYFKLFYEKMYAEYDYIKATRYADGGGMEGVSRKRQLVSRWGNRVARVLFRLPLTDPTNGFRAVARNVLEKLALTEDRFPVILEELCQAKRVAHSFAEVPYILTARTETQRITSFAYDLTTVGRYLYYAIKSSFYGRA